MIPLKLSLNTFMMPEKYVCIKYLGTFMYVFRLNIETCKQILILQIF